MPLKKYYRFSCVLLALNWWSRFGLANFFYEGQTVNILGFLGHLISDLLNAAAGATGGRTETNECASVPVKPGSLPSGYWHVGIFVMWGCPAHCAVISRSPGFDPLNKCQSIAAPLMTTQPGSRRCQMFLREKNHPSWSRCDQIVFTKTWVWPMWCSWLNLDLGKKRKKSRKLLHGVSFWKGY